MPAPSTPDWLVGYLNWRGLDLPVISYDAANGGHLAVPGDNRGRVVVLNTIGEHHHDMPFMGPGDPGDTQPGPSHGSGHPPAGG